MPHFKTLFGIISPCHLVLSVPWTLATVMIKLLHFVLSTVASLSSAKFIPVVSCITSIHLFLGCPCFLLPSPHANIISFSNPSDLMTCPKNLNFALSTVCCSVSSFLDSGSHAHPVVSSFLRPWYSLHFPPYPHFTCVYLLSHFLGHCPCLAAVCYCWYNQSPH